MKGNSVTFYVSLWVLIGFTCWPIPAFGPILGMTLAGFHVAI